MSAASLLFLHTCEVPGVVAAARGGRLVAQELGPRGAGGHTVLGALQRALATLQVGLADMDGVLVTTGPGSFTGIRVGIATAQGLATARGWRPLVCDALVVDAMACQGEPRPVAVCHDARRGEVYVRLYDVSGVLPVALTPAFCATPDAARARLQVASPAGGVCVGSGAGLVASRSQSWLEHEAVAAAALAQAAITLAARGGCAGVEALQLEPFYLRHPDLGSKRLGG